MPRWRQLPYQRLDVGHRDRVDAGKGLVEQHEDWIGGKGAGDFDAPPLAAGQRQGIGVSRWVIENSLEQAVEPRGTRLARAHMAFEHGKDVVLDAQAAKDRGLLRQIANAQPAALEQRQRGDAPPVEQYLAVVGPDQAHDDGENGRLAGPVRPEQPDGLAAPHGDADVAHDDAAPKTLGERVGHQPVGLIGEHVRLGHGLKTPETRPPSWLKIRWCWRQNRPQLGTGHATGSAFGNHVAGYDLNAALRDRRRHDRPVTCWLGVMMTRWPEASRLSMSDAPPAP